MATIYDDIPIIQDPEIENTPDSFIGWAKTLSITEDAILAQRTEKELEQRNWMLTTIEETILKAANSGEYSIQIIVPINYNYEDCYTFLLKAGYDVRQQGNRSLLVSWRAEIFKIYTTYHRFDRATGSGDITYAGSETVDSITLNIPKGTVITEEFIVENFPATFTDSKTEITYNLVLNNIEELNGPSRTPYGTIIMSSQEKISVYYLEQE